MPKPVAEIGSEYQDSVVIDGAFGDYGEKVSELGISNLVWQKSTLRFFVDNKSSPMTEEDIVRFCQEQAALKCTRQGEPGPKFSLELRKEPEERKPKFVDVQYMQTLEFEGNSYDISGCWITISSSKDGRYVTSTIVPDTGLIHYPPPRWFGDAKLVSVTKGYSEDPYEFPVDFFKAVAGEEEHDDIYDAFGNLVPHRTCF